MKSVLCLLILMAFSSLSFSATPTCHANGADPYCKYTGSIQKVYINAGNLILIYFESSIDVALPQGVGFPVTSGNAAALIISESNSDFAQLLYSTALAAKMAGNEVTIQMRGNEGGYLKVDRIWLN